MVCRMVLILVAALLGSGAVSASDPQPAELPPQDFTARQYIDSMGCVFLRQEGGRWSSRLARDGAQICGYPPTFSARRTSPEEQIALFPPTRPEPSKAQQIEEALTEIVITNLRSGELLGDSRPRAQLRDAGPEPLSTGPVEALRAEIAAAPRIRAEMGSGLRPNQDLCRLLGYNGKSTNKPSGASGLGQDPTQGFCDALPRSDLARLAFARPIPVTGTSPKDAGSASEVQRQGAETEIPTENSTESPKPPLQKASQKQSVLQKPSLRKQASQKAGQTKAVPEKNATKKAEAEKAGPKKAAQQSNSKEAAAKVALSEPIVPLLSSGARYVQVGVYSEAANAERAISKMTQLGLPVLRNYAQGQGPRLHVIVSGPYDTRQTLVIALDRIRQAGFRDAYPR